MDCGPYPEQTDPAVVGKDDSVLRVERSDPPVEVISLEDDIRVEGSCPGAVCADPRADPGTEFALFRLIALTMLRSGGAGVEHGETIVGVVQFELTALRPQGRYFVAGSETNPRADIDLCCNGCCCNGMVTGASIDVDMGFCICMGF